MIINQFMILKRNVINDVTFEVMKQNLQNLKTLEELKLFFGPLNFFEPDEDMPYENEIVSDKGV